MTSIGAYIDLVHAGKPHEREAEAGKERCIPSALMRPGDATRASLDKSLDKMRAQGMPGAGRPVAQRATKKLTGKSIQARRNAAQHDDRAETSANRVDGSTRRPSIMRNDHDTFMNSAAFANTLAKLRQHRKHRVALGLASRPPRTALTRPERAQILSKCGGRCHICGGSIEGDDWQADHVLAHSGGGKHNLENYLPAHSVCNNYRWHYDAEEFQWILKLGVWLRTQIENETGIGQAAGKLFCGHERRRISRRKAK
jgi:5-methylcytosine-specific restriction endonuclease McrA